MKIINLDDKVDLWLYRASVAFYLFMVVLFYGCLLLCLVYGLYDVLDNIRVKLGLLIGTPINIIVIGIGIYQAKKYGWQKVWNGK